MSRAAVAEHLLYEHFGAAVGLVGSVLLARGRLSYETLIRLVPRTLTQATVQASILVLVQHNCLYHTVDEDDGREYFEVDLARILERRRFGSLLALAREYWGSRSQDVIMRVLSEGKVRLSTLLEDCLANPSSSNSAHYLQTIKAIYDLLNLGVLRRVKATDHVSVADQDLQYYRELLRNCKGPPQPKELKDFRTKVQQRRAELGSDYPDWSQDKMAYHKICQDLEEAGFADRKKEGEFESADPVASPPKKRRALPSLEQTRKSSDEIFVRVQIEPFDIRIRNELIVKAVRVQRGGAAARLISTMLNETLKSQTNLRAERTDFVRAGKLVEPANRRSPVRKPIALPDNASGSRGGDSSMTNGYHDDAEPDQHSFYTLFPDADAEVPATLRIEPSGVWRASEKQPIELVTEVLHVLFNTADVRRKAPLTNGEEAAELRESAASNKPPSWLIVGDPEPPLHGSTAQLSSYQWAVDFASSHELLKLGLLEGYIKKTFSGEAFRIWRLVDDKGKMEEKQIAKIAMLPAKNVRENISLLSSAGFLQQQEVPRTLDRNPSRTFFLWYVSRKQCAEVVISRLYETLVNLQVRKEEEILKNRALLRRSERRDVRENLGLLEQGDQDELAELYWRTESIGIAQERIDRDLLILETLPDLL